MSDKYGFNAVPRNLDKLFGSKGLNAAPTPQSVAEIKEPDSQVARAVKAFAQQKLNGPTFNHSLRVYYYGRAITKDQFPDWKYDPEVYYAICLLHDIGTADEFISATKMSFEFYGAMVARDLIRQQTQDNLDYADAVFEAIALHQDITPKGYITTVGQLIQLATLIDNAGKNVQLLHRETIDDVNRNFRRQNWETCFAGTIRKENGLKPWSHTTTLGVEDFPGAVLSNKEMPYL